MHERHACRGGDAERVTYLLLGEAHVWEAENLGATALMHALAIAVAEHACR